MVANNIHPVKVNQPEDISELLVKLGDVLKGTPPPWLRKAMLKGQDRDPQFRGRGIDVSDAAVASPEYGRCGSRRSSRN